MKKVAIVTGSTCGIGREVASYLLQEGWHVMINGLGDVPELKSSAEQMLFHGADLTQEEQIKDLVQTTEKKWGQVDLLVNNAGIQHVEPVDTFPLATWNKILSLNLTAYFSTIQAVLPIMKKQKRGRIINMASTHGLVASAHKSAYVAAKHGVVGLTKTVALETVQTGVTCHAICPGWVLTPLVEKQIQARVEKEGLSFEKATRDLLVEKQPSGAFVQAMDIAQMVVFLTSPAADAMTGSIITMDGGWTSQ